MIKKNERLIFLVILLLLGFATHFYLLGTPNEVVFDEVHFGKFSEKYLVGEYFFDVHPPLGKLIIALGAKFGGYGEYLKEKGTFDFSLIGNDYGSAPIFWFRLPCAFAGALLPVIIFLFLESIGITQRNSFFSGLLIIFENSLLTQSRFALLDIFLLFFGFLGLYTFFVSRKSEYNLALVALSGAFFSASFSIKWTGLSYIAIALLVLSLDFLKRIVKNKAFPRIFKRGIFLKDIFSIFSQKIILSGVIMIIVYFVFYALFFYIHFSLFSDFYPKSAENRTSFLAREFVELNLKMYEASSSNLLEVTHPEQSGPLEWLMLKKPIHFWSKQENKQVSEIILVGNPFIWILGLIGVVFFPFFWKKIKIKAEIKMLLLFGFFINFLPFFMIKRLLFIYHYFSALIFSIIIFSVLFFVFEKKRFFMPAVSGVVLLAFLFFLFFSNYTYGLPVSSSWQKTLLDLFNLPI